MMKKRKFRCFGHLVRGGGTARAAMEGGIEGRREEGKRGRREDGKTGRREDGKTGRREDGKTGRREDGKTGRREEEDRVGLDWESERVERKGGVGG